MEDKIYFQPGDIVVLNKELPYSPKMIVVKKETSMFKHKEDAEGILKGIKCRWFTTSGELLEAIFNTKDLTKVKE